MLRCTTLRLIAVVAVLVCLATGCATGSGPVEGVGAPLNADPSATTPPTGPPATISLPNQVPAAGGNNLATLTGTARSVSTTAAATGLTSIHLTGPAQLTAHGSVVDARGDNLGTGTLTAASADTTVSAVSLQLAGTLLVQPSQVQISGAGVTAVGPATITAQNLMFQPAAAAPPVTSGAVSTTVAPPIAVAGPAKVTSDGIQLGAASLVVASAPTDLRVSSQEADFSWAGSGSIVVAGQTLRDPYLGVRAQQLQVNLTRNAGGVGITGTGLALQAYANGMPQLRVQARFDILSTHATTGFIPERHAFVWTPRNLDNIYDMAILSIHPANAAAGGVHVGLLPMPPMFGGVPHALVGGDTAGLKGGDAIDSLIARHGDDKRTIGYDAPPGVPVVLVIQGNFDPITVTVTTY